MILSRELKKPVEDMVLRDAKVERTSLFVISRKNAWYEFQAVGKTENV